ncbi:response regulator [Mangrovimonas sp. ST2L15]|uniref:response regulator n=1 Tax=Mangrovimonas sp. ST2L15 TaxID=1645916 RepID=UPI0006B6492D|nr:response regulator [Mangrovimonas sp. ST2L15]
MQKKTIVYIEDRLEDIMLLERIVRKEFNDIHLISLNDSEQVLEFINNGEFAKLSASLVLLDIKMPKVNGFELLEALQEFIHYENIPKIIFSSSTHLSDINKAYQLKCNSYVEKPKTYLEFKNTLNSTLSYWLNINLN